MKKTSSAQVALSFLLYTGFALAGAFLGRMYYFPNPPALSLNFIMPDLRHGGAIAGGLIGAVAAAVFARYARSTGVMLTGVLALLAFCALEILLFQQYPVVGLATTAVLLLPWILAFFIAGRHARPNAA